MERILNYTAEENYIGERLKTLLKRHFRMSTSLITDLKRAEDGICVNGERKKVNYIIKDGDEVTLTMRESASEKFEPVEIPLDIVYEDEDVIIINKPSGIPTHPSPGHRTRTVANALVYYFLEKGEECMFHAVNRLDKETSGLMAAAKSKYSRSLLDEEIGSGDLKRRYIAIVRGIIEENGVVDAPIGRAEDSVIKRVVSPDGQRAVTHYRVLRHLGGEYTVLELELETGRTHQIRVHMAYIGHPLLGDWLYGFANRKLIKRIALHSSYIRLIQPVTGKVIEFSAEPPEDMQGFIENFSEIEKDGEKLTEV